MRQKQRCADMLTQAEQVAVRQSRQRIFVKTGLRFCAVPSDVKSVAIDRQFRLQSLLALRNQRMAGVITISDKGRAGSNYAARRHIR